MAGLRPQFVLLGDSITQQSFGKGGWASAIADVYQRRVDVINRGYSGYNTRWALPLLEHIFPAEIAGEVQLAIVFYGANDAALPDRTSSAQHVPIPEYISNMKTIISHLRGRNIPHVLLITPPPVHEPARIKHVLSTYNVVLEHPERTNEIAGQYADAVIALGRELGLPVVDLWRAIQNVNGWQDGLLSDGLHLSPEGNEFVGGVVLKAIKDNFTDLDPEKMPFDIPDWRLLADPEDNAAAIVAGHRRVAAEKRVR